MATKRRYFGCTGSLSRKLGYYIGFARVLDEGLIYRSDYRYSLIWEVRKLAVLELFLVLAIYFSASGIIHYFFGTKAPFGDFFYSTAAVGLFYTFFYFYFSYYSFFFSSESSLLSLLGENLTNCLWWVNFSSSFFAYSSIAFLWAIIFWCSNGIDMSSALFGLGFLI